MIFMFAGALLAAFALIHHRRLATGMFAVFREFSLVRPRSEVFFRWWVFSVLVLMLAGSVVALVFSVTAPTDG